MIKNKFTARPTQKELKLAYQFAHRAKKAREQHKLTQHVWERLVANTSRRRREVNFQYKDLEERRTIINAIEQIPGLTYTTRRFANSSIRYIVVSGWA